MQEKKKIVITANHVLFFGGLIGTLLILVSMGIYWVRNGTPFFEGTNLIGNPILDTLFTLVWPLSMVFWGWAALRAKKREV